MRFCACSRFKIGEYGRSRDWFSFSAPRFEAGSKLFLKAYFSEGVNFAREKNCAYINMEHKLRDGRGFRSVKSLFYC